MNDRTELRRTLDRQPFLAELTAGDRDLLAGLAAFVTLREGELLTDEGAPVACLWILVEGRVRVEIGRGAGRTPIAVLGPGSVFGEASYLSGRPASASVEALADCRLVELAQDDVRAACGELPSFGLRFERLLVALFSERLSRSLGGDANVELPRVDGEALKSLRTLRLRAVEAEAVARYGRFGNRDPFLWRWCLRALELTTLPSVPEGRRLEVRAAKFLAAVTVVIVDDVADAGLEGHALDESLAVVGHAPPPDEPAAVDAGLREELAWAWSALAERAGRLPNNAALADLLAFDWHMVFTANRHARLARDEPAVTNPTENMELAPHGIAMMVFATLDLMASPRLELSDLRATRELVHAGQTLCELANMIATWRREIPERDFGSRIFTLGLAQGTFTSEDLRTLPTGAIVARVEQTRLEEQLIDEWRAHRARADEAAARIDGYDPSSLLAGYDAVFGLTLAARGSI